MQYRLGYEDTDKKIEIEIYGIKFELPRINKEYASKLQEEIEKENQQDLGSIEKIINLVLGANAFTKINNRRVEDNRGELDIMGAMQIIAFTQKIIAQEIVKSQSTLNADIKDEFNKTSQPYNGYKPRNNKRPYNNYRR